MKGYTEVYCNYCTSVDELFMNEKTSEIVCYDCLMSIYSCNECGYINFQKDKQCHKCGITQDKE